MGKKVVKVVQCTGTTKSGKQCSRNAMLGRTRCREHGVENDLDALHHEYNSAVASLSRFADSLQDQLYKLLNTNDLTLGVPIEARVKDWGSLSEKLDRKQLAIESIK